jgi:hypothetical protein
MLVKVKEPFPYLEALRSKRRHNLTARYSSSISSGASKFVQTFCTSS